MEPTVDLETIATLVTVIAAAVGVAVANSRAIRGLRLELKGDIGAVRTELGGLRTELKGDIAGLRAELKGDIAELRAELKGDIAKLDDRVYALAAGLAPRLEPASGTEKQL
jgi:hypothetical protein